MHDPERPMRATAALAAHLELIASDIERWLALFADDAIVDFLRRERRLSAVPGRQAGDRRLLPPHARSVPRG